ncbi:Maf family nucleotide pyrophosphatase [Adhaeribacter pallidiroseus]|uniref:dTTP/UTP pyrophosphatase n=1 Tax=Adhaeribacter pallidiroseus TaxID=2072847 RepID=A0A369QIQ9_9BACT|nr:Maf family nucleotide pyrophosphatase [Adhaeribacter pallidiroseus]RDC63147.1 Maf-like protein [Adhaeribacter pallidiroseus]
MNFTSKILLASNSPRRHELLTMMGLPFTVRVKEVPEDFPDHLKKAAVAEYLAGKKAAAYLDELQAEELLITADTIVCLDDQVLNKPVDFAEAQAMLQALSGRMHEVYTGVCLLSRSKKVVFHDVTRVFFKNLTNQEITGYIHKYKPYDKAGAYGAQDWIGMVAIQRLEGSFYNVMGLPVHRLYTALQDF